MSSTAPGPVGDVVSGMVDSTKEAAGEMMGQIRQQAGSRFDDQKQAAAAGLASLAGAVRQMGEGLKQQDQGPIPQFAAEYGQVIANQVERLSGYLREKDLHEVVQDVESFARRQPAYFLAGAFLLGLAGSRFLKSSRPAPRFLSDLPNPNRALPPASYGSLSLPTTPASQTPGSYRPADF